MPNDALCIPDGLFAWARRLYDRSREDVAILRDSRGRAVELYVPFDHPQAGLRHYRLCRRGGEMDVLLADASDRPCRLTGKQRRDLEDLFRQLDEREAGIDFLADPAAERICT